MKNLVKQFLGLLGLNRDEQVVIVFQFKDASGKTWVTKLDTTCGAISKAVKQHEVAA